MNIDGKAYRTISVAEDGWRVTIIDQTCLPHEFTLCHLESVSDVADAIKHMQVRGAPLIGATAAYGMAIATKTDASITSLNQAYELLMATRPTAVNLRWALNEMMKMLTPLAAEERQCAAYQRAAEICDEDVEICSAIGDNGLTLIESLWAKKQRQNKADSPINVLTHCNAGWLATVDWGTALSPIYKAHNAGIPIHVWVDETRPRNQGFHLTAWELNQHGVPHTIIVDNVGGHLMQHDQVDLCIVGTDRTTSTGDVCNKIGTYLKALAAYDNQVPFYVALPGPTIDWTMGNGVENIPIEERDPHEVTHITGQSSHGEQQTISISPSTSHAANYAFDVTPSRLVTGLITERGIISANAEALANAYPEKVL